MSAAKWPALWPLALAWLAYFAVHSALASRTLKGWVERRYAAVFPAYRLAYNLIAVLLLVPIVALFAARRGASLWVWSGAAAWLANALALAALAAVLVTTRYYDGGEFLGLRQWAGRRAAPGSIGEELRLSPLHRYVRHPWYSATLVLIWTRDMDGAMLVSALMISAYLVLGSRLEEGRLIGEFGAVYRLYRQRVGGLVPLPWKTLSAAEAARFEAAARAHGEASGRTVQPPRSSRV